MGISISEIPFNLSSKYKALEIQLNASLIGDIKADSLLPNTNKAIEHFNLEIYTEIDDAIIRTIEWYLMQKK